jgi:3-oxoacyl-[acyl-carrier protein] reductase
VKKKNLFITGGTGAIGQELIKKYIDNNYNIFFTVSSKKNKIINQLNKISFEKKASCKFVVIDFSREDINEWKKKINKLLKGINRIDTLINNAGFLQQKKFTKINSQDWQITLDINLKSVFFVTQILKKFLKKDSSVINISSIGGQIGGHLAPHYAASKAGVISLTRSFSKIYAKSQIRVNCVSPGVIETKMVSKMISKFGKKKILESYLIKRLGNARDVVEICYFLSSPKSQFITGQTYNVNGGSYFG